MDMNLQINRLLNFALQQGLIAPEDKYYSANLLLDLLGVDEFEVVEVDETLPIAHDILENMLDYAVEKGLCEDTVTQRDLFDTRIMNCVMPRPSEVVGIFKNYTKNQKFKLLIISIKQVLLLTIFVKIVLIKILFGKQILNMVI